MSERGRMGRLCSMDGKGGVRRLSMGVLVALLGVPAWAGGQPPTGPAQVIEGARQAQAAEETEAAMQVGDRTDAPPTQAPPGQATQAQTAQTQPVEGQPTTPSPSEQAALARAQGRNTPPAHAEARASVPVGTIRVLVTDGAGRPVPNAEVRVGIMRQAGARGEELGRTDARGVHAFSGLATGSGQAYRVTVPHQGATYATRPFRLELDRGHEARIRRLPTTESQRALLMTVGQMMLEYKNDRVHVTEQARVANLGSETVVFGETGVQMQLPRGFTAFQSQDVMTDQRIVPNDDGFRIEGSMTPGTVTLTWAYDLPLEGSEVSLSRSLPFRTFRFRVLTDAAEGMSLDVAGFPSPETHRTDGRRVLLTATERGPEEAPLDRIDVQVRGIPTAGPARYVAVGGMLVLLILGFLLLRTERRGEVLTKAREARREELLADATELARLHEKGEVGPKFYARRMGEITDELASLLRLEEADGKGAEAGSRLSPVGVAMGVTLLLYAGAAYSVFVSMQYFDTRPTVPVVVVLAVFPFAAFWFVVKTNFRRVASGRWRKD